MPLASIKLVNAKIAVFDNGTYVDTFGGIESESDNVQASLAALGHVVAPFTGLDATSFSAALVEKDVLLIPELEFQPFLPDVATRDVIRQFVNNGGTLIINGEGSYYAENFLNSIFGWSLVPYGSTASASRTGATSGTTFADDPLILPAANGTYGISSSSLPGGALNLYANSTATFAAAMPFGGGQVVFLAYDWYDAAPRGFQNSGWLQVLDSAVSRASLPPPSTPDLVASSDYGSSNSDNLTFQSQPAFSGTAAPGATVTLYDTDGTTVLGTAVANGTTGIWSITTVGPLSQGAHTVTATASLGGVSSLRSSGLVVTIDTTPPAPPSAPDLTPLSDTGASDTDNITQTGAPTFTGTAGLGERVVLLDSDGESIIGMGVADATTGIWSIRTDIGLVGPHTITAKALDAAGNVSAASASLTLTVDIAAPAPSTPDMTAASDTGITTDNITSMAAPTFTGTAEAGATVRLYDTNGTSVLGATTADATTGAWSITSAVLSEGAHTITAKATDIAGNTSAASPGLTITIDAAGPAAPTALALAAGSDSGASPTDRITAVTAPTITGTAEAGASVTLYDTDGTTILGSGMAHATTGAWSITTSTLSQGDHAITARATDLSGTTGAASGPLSVRIDSVAPSAPSTPDLAASSDTGASDSDNYTQTANPTFTGLAEAGARVTLYGSDGVTSIGSGTADASTGAWSITTTSALSGPATVTAKATDAAGNVSVSSTALPLNVDNLAPAPSKPDMTETSDTGVNDDNVTSLTTPTFVGVSEPGATVSLYDTNGTTLLGTTLADASTGAWSITSTALAEGNHSILSRVTDRAGNMSTSSLSITIDTGAPAAPSAPALAPGSDTGASPTDRITSIATPTITGTAEAGARVTLYDTGGTTVIGTGMADAVTGAWSITTSTLSSTDHLITARAADASGTLGPASPMLTIRVDTTPPVANAPDLISDTGVSFTDNLTSSANLVFAGPAEGGSTVTLYEGATVRGSVVADASTDTWQISVPGLAPGAHTFTTKVTDVAGNVSAASSGLTVNVDRTAPAASSAPDLTAASDTGVNNDNITANRTPTFTGTAEPGAQITLVEGVGSIVGTGIADATTGVWTITSSLLAPGARTFRALVVDAAGNPGPYSASLTVDIVAGTPGAPSAPDLVAASDSWIQTDNLTDDATPTLSGTAEAGSTVTLYDTDGVTVLGSTVANGTTGAWSITTPALALGDHTLTAKAANLAGAASPASAPLVVTVVATNHAPVASAGGPYAPNESGTVILAGSATDADTVHGDSVTYAWDLDNDGAFDDATGPGPILNASALTNLGLATGAPRTIRLQVTDAQGLTNVSTTAVTVPVRIVGTEGDDSLAGTAGGDTIEGLGGNDTLFGSGGDDVLDGGYLSDSLQGGEGADTLIDSESSDALDGGPGADRIVSAGGVINGGEGDDTILITAPESGYASGDGGADTLTGAGGRDYFNGGDGQDSLQGGAGDDYLDGGAAADTIAGGAGVDSWLLGPTTDGDVILDYQSNEFILLTGLTAANGRFTPVGGDMQLQVDLDLDGTFDTAAVLRGLKNYAGYVGDGFALLVAPTGTDDNDVMYGDAGDNTLSGGRGGDIINGFGGADTLSGELGDDVLDGGEGADLLDGGLGADSLKGGQGSDTLIGGQGIDVLNGEAGDDSLNGGGDSDTITAGEGSDTIDGGTGVDAVTYSDVVPSAVTVNLSLTAPQNTGGGGVDKFIGIEGVLGTGFADTLIGDSADNSLAGGFGSDSLAGGSGDDTLLPAYGGDTMSGGAGVDDFGITPLLLRGLTPSFGTFEGGRIVDYEYGERIYGSFSQSSASQFTSTQLNADTRVIKIDSAGIGLQLNGQVTGTLIVSSELGFNNNAIYIVPTGAIAGTGAGNNLSGSSALDRIYGLAGADTLQGLAGDDTLHGGADNDSLNGGLNNDSLLGGSGFDRLRGGDGNDTLDGGSSDDTADYRDATGGIYVDLALTTVQDTRTAGQDLLISIENVWSANFGDTLAGDGKANSLFGFGGSDSLAGRDGNDNLVGSFGADTIDGGAGSDTVIGGEGDEVGSSDLDVLRGGEGVDLLTYSATQGSGDSGYVGVAVSLAVSGQQTTGGAGVDVISGFEQLYGSAYADTLIGDGAANTIAGWTGADSLSGGEGDDVLAGHEGPLVSGSVIMASGADTFAGGDGDDTYYLATLTGNRITDYESGERIIVSGNASWTAALRQSGGNTLIDIKSGSSVMGTITLDGVVPGQVVVGRQDNNMVLQVVDPNAGTPGPDTMVGTAGVDTLSGLGGNDSLRGLAGMDRLLGGSGTDTLEGGADADTLSGGSGVDLFRLGDVGELHGDRITDYAYGEKIVLNQSLFSWLDTGLRFESDYAIVDVDADHDGVVDGGFILNGITSGNLKVTSGEGLTNNVLTVVQAPKLVFGGFSPAAGSGEVFTFDSPATNQGATNVYVAIGGFTGTSGLPTSINSLADWNAFAEAMIAKTDEVETGDLVISATGQNLLAIGGSGNDSIASLSALGPSRLFGRAGEDTLAGNAGRDTLDGGAGADILTGNGGDDRLIGGAGADQMSGEVGVDAFYAAQAADLNGDEIFGYEYGEEIILGQSLVGAKVVAVTAGSDVQLKIDAENDGEFETVATLRGRASGAVRLSSSDGLTNNVIKVVAPSIGTPGPDTLVGTTEADTLQGLGGADSLAGLAGSDSLSGGEGTDTLMGGQGADTLSGGQGPDVFRLGTAAEANGDRVVDYSYGEKIVLSQSLSGTAAVGMFATNGGSILQIDGDGNGSFETSLRLSFVYDGPISLSSEGGFTNNVITLNATNAIVAGGYVEDTGEGDVSVFLSPADSGGTNVHSAYGAFTGLDGLPVDIHSKADIDSFAEALIAKTDQVDTTGVDVRVYAATFVGVGGLGDDKFTVVNSTGSARIFGRDGADTLRGYNFADTLDGGEGGDSLSGGSGNDSLFGGAGPDTLSGGEGADTVSAGAGADSLSGGNGADLLVFGEASAGVRADLGQTGAQSIGGASVTLTGFESLAGSGYGDTLIGGGVSAGLFGDAGSDSLQGGAAADSLAGGAGADTLAGGAGADVYAAATAADLNGDHIVGYASGETILLGHSLAAPGDVRLAKVGGVLQLQIDADHDGAFETTVTLDGLTGGEFTLSSQDGLTNNAIRITPRTGPTAGPDSLWGDAEADTLAGLAGADTIDGREGNDSLSGDDDNDWLTGGAGADTISGGAGLDLFLATNAADLNGDRILGYQYSEAFTMRQSLASASNIRLTQSGSDLLLQIDADNNGTFEITTTLVGVSNAQLTVISENGFNNNAFWLREKPPSTGTGGPDLLNGTADADTLSGLGGGDTLEALGGADSLSGGADNDSLVGGAGGDTVDGGSGVDAYLAYAAGDMNGDRVVGYEFGETFRLHQGLASASNVKITRSGSDTLLQIDGDNDGVFEVTTTLAGVTTGQLTVASDGGFTNNLISLRSSGGASTGGTGPDGLSGGPGADTLRGLAGSDTLEGGEGADSLNGGDDDDSLNGGPGNDTLDGGAGVDTGDYSGSPSGVRVDLSQGGSQTTGGAGEDQLTRVENLTGSSFGDTLAGSAGANVMDGAGGSDSLFGASSADTLVGGEGNDTLDGGPQADSLAGGGGDDLYLVDSAQDQIQESPGSGADRVVSTASHTLADEVEGLTLSGSGRLDGTGNASANVIVGGAGSNLLSGGGGNDSLAGMDGTDTLSGEADNDTLAGGDSNDSLSGGEASDSLSGDAGDDTLFGGAGVDTLAGGTGDDAYVLDGDGDQIVESATGGVDTVLSSTTTTLGANLENLTLTGSSAISGSGNVANNVVSGNGADNTLDGGSRGDDTLAGNDGSDVLDDDYGRDVLDGGSGNDTLSGGRDNDTLVGGSGTDRLKGGKGADSMDGGGGADIYVVDDVGDVVIDTGTAGADRIISTVSVTLDDSVEHLTLDGTDAVNGTGNAGNNSLVGNAGANSLSGGEGSDSLDGGGGADTLAGGGGDDDYTVGSSAVVIVEQAGGGTDTVTSSVGYTLGSDVENLTLTGNTHIDGKGNSGSNVITGNNGNNSLSGEGGGDTLSGLKGADTLTGSAGADSMIGGAGADLFVFHAGGGTDYVKDFKFKDGDRIGIEAGVTASVTREGSNTVIDFGDGDILTLSKVTSTTGSDAWFVVI